MAQINKEGGDTRIHKKGMGERRWKRLERFRLGCEIREGRYWKEESRRDCRMCKGKIELWEHMWEECREWEKGGKLAGCSTRYFGRGGGGGIVDEGDREGEGEENMVGGEKR